LARDDAGTRPPFTPLQGQYLAFIHAYTLVNGRPPAEADMMRFFRVTPPTVHRMVLALEQAGLISRQPGMPRSIVIKVDRAGLPMLEPGTAQPIKTSVQRY
jgi:DNA-binding MarR family transcriptional regulator